jgi:glucokinase
MGGTNTDMGLVSENGNIIQRRNIPTNAYTELEPYVHDMMREIEAMVAEQTSIDGMAVQLEGIGIGAPNGNFYTGCVDNAPNLTIKGNLDFGKEIHKYLSVPVVLSNDANAAAYGEYVYGGARGMKHFIMFTLGTGVGSGVVVDGKLVLGKTGGAGELGHAILIPEGRQCGCGNKGCLETYCSASGICRTALEMMENMPEYDGALRKVAPEELTSKMVGDAAKYGDPLAIKVFEKTGYLLGIAMANAVTFSGPEAIFLFGGPVKAGDVLLEPARKSFEEHLCFIFKDTVDIRVSELPDNDAAILGAAALTKA